MKLSIHGIFTVLLFLCTYGCSKDNALIQIRGSNISSATTSTIVGRQQVITIATGDYIYPTSQALLWLPVSYNAAKPKRYPLLISLGGISQNSSSDINVLLNDETVAKRISEGWNAEAINPANNKNYQFIVFSPTKNEPNSWGWSAAGIKVMLSELKKIYKIDSTRIYITGLSSGGWGLWSCMTDDTSLCKQFAAIGPVSSAGSDHPDKIPNVDKYGIACWNICGTTDSFYGLAVTYTSIINNNQPVITPVLTGLTGVGHSAWIQAYNPAWTNNGISFYQWLLQYKRKNY